MDKKRGLLNVSISIGCKIIILISMLVTRRLLIQYLGNEMNGISSLYTSIIGFLAVAELGVGSVIAFSMYKPIVENDLNKVAALYQLYKKVYLVVSLVILAAGIIVMPFLPYLAKDYAELSVNWYVTFGLALAAVVLSYYYSAKTSLLNAHKNNFITSICHMVAIVVQSGLQIVVLILFRSFELYLVSAIVGTLVQWLLTDFFVRKKHQAVLKIKKQPIDTDTKVEIIKNIKAMFMHRIGNMCVNTVDSIIISAFIGVVILGKYSNYTTLVTAMVSIISIVFTSLTSIVGHMLVSQDKKMSLRNYSLFYDLNYIIGFVCFLGYYAIVDDAIVLLFGANLALDSTIVKVITINYFIQFMRQATLLFRDASGTFYRDRWKAIVESIVNLILSLALVLVLPENYKVIGVILATIITNLSICHFVEPRILFKYVFDASPYKQYMKNYGLIIYFVVFVYLFDLLAFSFPNAIVQLLTNGLFSVVISLVALCPILLTHKKTFIHAITSRRRREKQ